MIGMKIALNEARRALAMDEVPVGAVIMKNGVLIAASYNTMHHTHNPLLHAEMSVIQMALEKLGENHLRGCDLYVTLEPCCMCAGAMELSGISRLYFGAYDIKMGQVDHNNRVLRHTKMEIIGGIREEECSTLLTDFFKTKRR